MYITGERVIHISNEMREIKSLVMSGTLINIEKIKSYCFQESEHWTFIERI